MYINLQFALGFQMSLNIANILQSSADKAVTFAAEVLRCGAIESYKTKDGESFFFLCALGDSSISKPLIMKAIFREKSAAIEKRQMFSQRPLSLYLNNVYMKSGSYVVATGNSHFFKYNGKRENNYQLDVFLCLAQCHCQG